MDKNLFTYKEHKKYHFAERVCKRCGAMFAPNVSTQIYCGSKTQKTGCSYRVHIEYIAKYVKENCREYMNEYQKKRSKKHRSENTEYAQRQRASKRKHAKTIEGKRVANEWRRNNTEKVLEYNRRRMLQKKNVLGSHIKDEWENLKKKHGYRCAFCRISEQELLEKWKGTNFGKLTRDHIVPIVLGGSDNADNIQPLCVSCNAKKKDFIYISGKTVIISGHFNPAHIGHIHYIQGASMLGGNLLAIVNNDIQVKIKGSQPFMNERERCYIISNIKGVFAAFLSIDKDITVCETIRKIHSTNPNNEYIFANGGNRKLGNIPEEGVCKELGIKMVFGVGGEKTQSSSWLLNQSRK